MHSHIRPHHPSPPQTFSPLTYTTLSPPHHLTLTRPSHIRVLSFLYPARRNLCIVRPRLVDCIVKAAALVRLWGWRERVFHTHRSTRTLLSGGRVGVHTFSFSDPSACDLEPLSDAMPSEATIV